MLTSIKLASKFNEKRGSQWDGASGATLSTPGIGLAEIVKLNWPVTKNRGLIHCMTVGLLIFECALEQTSTRSSGQALL